MSTSIFFRREAFRGLCNVVDGVEVEGEPQVEAWEGGVGVSRRTRRRDWRYMWYVWGRGGRGEEGGRAGRFGIDCEVILCGFEYINGNKRDGIKFPFQIKIGIYSRIHVLKMIAARSTILNTFRSQTLRSASTSSAAAIALEDKFGAHNYHPLPVVLSRGEKTKLWDVSVLCVGRAGGGATVSHWETNPSFFFPIFYQSSINQSSINLSSINQSSINQSNRLVSSRLVSS